MQVSQLSLKKVNNIDRQISLHKDEINDVIKLDNTSVYLQFNKSKRSCNLRNFFEFHVNNKPLISIISSHYWESTTNVNSDFFNSYVGCLGSFGKFWDEISIKILLKEAFTEEQCQRLFDMFKSNHVEKEISKSEEEIKDIIVKTIVDDFLFYCCQDCGDSGCGGITLTINKTDDKVIWTDNKKILIHFDSSQYEEALCDYLDKED